MILIILITVVTLPIINQWKETQIDHQCSVPIVYSIPLQLSSNNHQTAKSAQLSKSILTKRRKKLKATTRNKKTMTTNSDDSNCSSSSDDDDDLLLSSAPIFSTKKEERKEKASEKRAFNYLDTMLRKGEERLEQQTRIHNLYRQELNHEDEEEGEGEGGEEESDDIDKDDINDCSKGEEDVTNISNYNNTKKRKTNKFDSIGGNGNTKNDQKDVLKKINVNSKKIDINNEEYWSKLHSSMSKDSSFVVESDRRRQNLRDAVDGLDVLRMTHHDDSDANDIDDGMQSGIGGVSMDSITERSSIFGTRRLFGIGNTNSNNNNSEHSIKEDEGHESRNERFSLFSSNDEAMSELTSIVEILGNAPPRCLSKKNRAIWNDVRLAVIEPIKNAMESDLLPLMLEKRKQWVVKSDSDLIIPQSLIQWLIRTCMSGKSIGTEMHQGAVTMICTVMRHDNLIIFDSDAAVQDTSYEVSSKYIFQLDDITSILQQEFGLWLKEGPPPVSESKDNKDRRNIFQNEPGLKNAYEVWTAAFEMDLVDIGGDIETSETFLQQKWDNNGNCICAKTAWVVAAICRSGLDPCFHSGNRMLQSQGELLRQIFQWIYRRFKLQLSDMNYYQQWIKYAAEVSISLCSGLSTDVNPKGTMKSDNKGWLPLSLSVRTFQTIDQSNECIVNFFAHFACKAAQLCIGNTANNWDSKIERNAEALMQDMAEGISSNNVIPLKVRCVVTAEVVLDTINKVGEEITRDGPRFLAAVDIAIHCESVGISLFTINAKSIEKSVGVFYENEEQAIAMGDHFERLESLCQSVKKRVVSVLVDKNMMHVKELLSLASAIYRDCKSKARALTNKRESLFNKRQSGIEMFLKPGDIIGEEDKE